MTAAEEDPRELVLVIGAGRSGTSLTAGVFNRLGFYVPQPEVEANKTNPRGFGEPRWVVNFHAKLMLRYGVDLLDARPAAWSAAARVLDEPVELGYCRTWTGWQFDEADRVVVKDPRTAWFLPMWLTCMGELGVQPLLVTPLRHPTEVMSSVRTTDRDKHSDATRLGWWLNMMLHAEYQTRGARRAYILYDDVLRDWRGALKTAEQSLNVDLLAAAGPDAQAEVDDLVDPSLRRAPAGWDAVDVPAWLRDLAEATWQELLGLTQEAGDTADRRSALDDLRQHYVATYGHAEALAQSSIKTAAREARESVEAAPEAALPAATPSLALRVRRTASRWVRRVRKRRT
ncbi:MAG TPA: hypothetical protein VFH66_14535 [Mycobacteriales bacterium]|nr:hypothetical protein [Mycobacteriales bacterium]